MSEFSIQSVTGGVTIMDVSKENSEHAQEPLNVAIPATFHQSEIGGS